MPVNKQFLSITDKHGKEVLVNSRYVIVLAFDRPDNGATLILASLGSEGGRGKLELSEAEAVRVKNWLSNL